MKYRLHNIAGAGFLFAISMTCSAAPPSSAPYSYKQFQNILNSAKLQHPKSQTKWQKRGFKNKSDKNFFYATKKKGGAWITFRTSGKRNKRTELRQLKEWSSRGKHFMSGTIKLSETSSKQFTVLQVHNSQTSAPLLRIEYKGGRYSAKINNNGCKRNCTSKSTTFHLCKGKKAKNFRVGIEKKMLKINFCGQHKSFKIKHWRDSNFYFKAGAYLQKPGTAVVHFKNLSWN